MTYQSKIAIICASLCGLAAVSCGGSSTPPRNPSSGGGGGGGGGGYDEYGSPAPAPVPAPAPTPPADGAAANPPPAAAAPPAEAKGPVHERARQFRDAADLLDNAAAARDRDAKSYADQLFSNAELIVGVDALAELAPLFREGAPPRVQTPPKKLPKDSPAQPVALGDSDSDRPEPPKPRRGTLTGVVTADGKSLGDVGVVTLTPIGKKGLPPIPTARVMEQRGRKFAPHVLVVPTGSIVAFPNFDPFFHNVFSTSQTKPFDLGLYRTNEAREVQFNEEGVVRVACNLHANMSALIVVVSAPHYTITDGDGKFTFKNIEPGKYTLRAIGERMSKPMTQDVEIKAGKNELAVGVVADAPAGPLPDKFGVARAVKKP